MTRGFTRGRGANRKFIPTDHGSSGGRVRLSGRKHSSMGGRLPSGPSPTDRSSANYYKNARAMEDHGYVEVPDSIYGGTSRYTLKNGKSITLKSGLTKAQVEGAIEFEGRPPLPRNTDLKAVSGQGPPKRLGEASEGDYLVRSSDNRKFKIVEVRHEKEFDRPVSFYVLEAPENGAKYTTDGEHILMNYKLASGQDSEPNEQWHSWKSSSTGYTNYATEHHTPLTTPVDFTHSDYDHPYKEIETEVKLERQFGEHHRYTNPYEVKIEYSTSEVATWRGSNDQTMHDIKNAELAYMTVGFPTQQERDAFVVKAKRVLGRMELEDVQKYHNEEGRKLIQERSSTRTWGDANSGTEARIRKALDIDQIEARHEAQLEVKAA